MDLLSQTARTTAAIQPSSCPRWKPTTAHGVCALNVCRELGLLGPDRTLSFLEVKLFCFGEVDRVAHYLVACVVRVHPSPLS